MYVCGKLKCTNKQQLRTDAAVWDGFEWLGAWCGSNALLDLLVMGIVLPVGGQMEEDASWMSFFAAQILDPVLHSSIYFMVSIYESFFPERRLGEDLANDQ